VREVRQAPDAVGEAVTRYRHTGMHENILILVTHRPGIGDQDLIRALTPARSTPDDRLLVTDAIRELEDANRLEWIGTGGGYRLGTEREPLRSRLRAALLSFPGIPRYGARRSQKGSE
jgi:hypothetical protein